MVQKSCTSWGWQFLPLFIRFSTSKRWLLGIPAPCTVVESFRPEALQFLAAFQGHQATTGRKLLDMRRRRRWKTDEDEDEVKLGWISGVFFQFSGDISHLRMASWVGVRSKMWGKRTKRWRCGKISKISVLVGWTTRLNHHFLCTYYGDVKAPQNKGHIARPAWIIWKALEY